jgi:hypothetical protein
MSIPGINPAKGRYLIRFLSTTGVYVIVSLALVHYLVRVHPAHIHLTSPGASPELVWMPTSGAVIE